MSMSIIAAVNVYGQISGTVTINNGAPGTSTNFQNFTALAATLNSAGVSGPLVVDVVPGSGPYVEQPQFIQAPGVSSTNSILINGNHCLLTYTNNSGGPYSDWTLFLKGADHMTFNDLNISSASLSYNAVATRLCEGADNNTFSNCSFSITNYHTLDQFAVAITPDLYSTINGGDASSSGDYNTFRNCSFYSGACGVLLIGNSSPPYNTGNSFVDCQLINWGYYGINASFQVNLTVKGCVVDRSTNTVFAVGWALRFYKNAGGLKCERNCIQNLAGTMSTAGNNHLHGIHYDATGMPAGLAANTINGNVIRNIVTQAPAFGIELTGFNGDCVGNIVDLNNGDPSFTGTVCAFYANPGNVSPDSMRVLGNYFSITHKGSGPKYCVYLDAKTRSRLDYNWYFIAPGLSGNNSIGFVNNSAAQSFPQWQAQGMDPNGEVLPIDPNIEEPITCSSTTVISTVGLTSHTGPTLMNLFPNPANEVIHFKFGSNKNRTVEILNSYGAVCIFLPVPIADTEINIRDLSSGIYLIRVKSEESIECRRIIKE
jgi:hypothetical protein